MPLDGVDGSLVVEVAPDGACVYLTPADGRTRYLLAFPQSAVLSSTGGALRLEVGSRETTFVDGERGSVGGHGGRRKGHLGRAVPHRPRRV